MRSRNAVASRARRKRILGLAKGYFLLRKNVVRQAKPAVARALMYATRDRKQRKRQFRRLWIQRINAFVTSFGCSYSKFINVLKVNNIELNRKVLADLAVSEPATFEAILKELNLAK